MSNFNYTRIRSSWNPDRMAACQISKPHAQRTVRRPGLYAQYRDNEVSVCSARGKVRFTLEFDRDVVSAIVSDNRLIVETADACVRHYDVKTCNLVSEVWPTPPEGGSFGAAFSFAA